MVRVRNCSMCGTDLKIVTHGHHRIAGPRILGHEIAGQVAETGPGVLRLTGGRGADVVIVCAASSVAQQQALRMTARRSRVSLFAGLPKDNGPVSLDTNLIHYRELRVLGAAGATPARNATALDLIATGQAAVADLITHRFGLTDIHAALEMIKQGTAIKATSEP